MPFDALVATAPPRSLSEIIADRAIEPISQQILADHKQAQLDKFAPSFWYQHQSWLPIGLMGSVGCMAFSGGLANRLMSPSSLLPCGLTFAWLCVLALLVVFGVFRLHAGSHWDERWVPAGWLHTLGVPEPIASMAQQLQRDIPNTSLILGELKQEAVVLDPYLLLERDGEVVCLGIWDGDRIIGCAA